jgi:hypothetical protein
MLSYVVSGLLGRSALQKRLKSHFAGVTLAELATASRTFPITARVDIQRALDDVLSAQPAVKLVGVHSQVHQETPTLAHLFTRGPFPFDLGPLQHDEIDIGDETPVRCLRNGLWLARQGETPFAVLLSPAMTYGRPMGVHLEIAVPSGERGAQVSQELFRDLEVRVAAGRTYRGRVLSLETYDSYSGQGGAVKVHRLHRVAREDVILPAQTLTLIDRNVARFVAARDHIKALRFSAKKGLLFYGPPGTGKTHTIHYLASVLPEHTTLLITSEQVILLDEYFRLARFLQPAIMVIEDIDLIAREREHMHNPMQEMLLNKLLNQMDGLREDAEILFILTTNRPDQIEAALASRPGRIDQAIEFPLPDAEGRMKLAALYARGVAVPPDVMDLIVRRTEGMSPAFIKELMRRSAQFQLELGGGAELQAAAVDSAIEEMVFVGGSLNVKLLGGSVEALRREHVAR